MFLVRMRPFHAQGTISNPEASALAQQLFSCHLGAHVKTSSLQGHGTEAVQAGLVMRRKLNAS